MIKIGLPQLKMFFHLLLLGWSGGILAQPEIISFSPGSGSIGTLLIINGTALNNPTSFTIGGVDAIVISNDGSTLVGLVMPGASTGNISITTDGGTVSSAGNFTVALNSFLPTTQQGGKLVGSDYTGSSIYHGASVSLSADGNTAIVGGYTDNSNIGAAWIYTRSGGIWTQQGSKLVGTGNTGTSYQGSSVSLSADGNTAIVGGYTDNSNIGAAWIYTRSGGIWTQQGGKLVGSGASGASYQGSSVSLSADGNTAIVGGHGDNSNIGAAWIYTRSASIWTQQGNKLVGAGYTGNSSQGRSVSLSADGNTAMVGGFGDNSDIGAVWIYTRSGSTWTQQGSKLVGTGYAGTSYQGVSVSLSANGNTAIVGGRDDNISMGAVWIYTRSGSTWTQQGSKLVGAGYIGTSAQGSSVSISADGNTAIVGGYTDNNNIGAVWIYSRTGSTWTQQGTKLVGTAYTGTPYQGYSVAISADGSTAMVGGFGDDNNKGAAWALVIPPPPTITSFTPASGNTGTLLTISGTSLGNPTSFTIGGVDAIVISNDGSTMVAMVMPGASSGNISITTGGGTVSSAGNFTVISSSLVPTAQQGSKLVGTGNNGNSYQGVSSAVSADGNTAIIGGHGDNGNIGAAWIYTRSGGLWTQQGSKLVGTGYSGSSYQGISVSISADGNTAIVGGTGDNSTIGAAWIYTRSGGIWTQQGGKLVGSGASGASRQGQSVSISADGNTAIVGGFYDNSTIGAAWIYTRSGGIWTQEGGKLVGTGAVGISGQGIAVSLSADGNTAIVGGYRDNTDIGAAWIYTRSGSIWTQQGSKLVGSGYVGNPVYQGNSVSLSADGNTAMVGGQYDNSGIGASWIFTRSGSTWTQQGGKLVGSGATGASRQGQTVSLSADGNTAILGGWGDNNNIGAVWIYSRSGNIWTQQGNKLVGSAYAGTPYQGYSVAISADGSTALFGGHWDNSGIGAAWALVIPPPPTITSFTPASGNTGTLLTISGTSLGNPTSFTIGGVDAIVISNDGSTMVAMVMPGASSGNISITTGGGTVSSAGNFTVISSSLVPTAQQGSKLVGTGNNGNSYQGVSSAVSADGNTAIIGGHGDNGNIGAAWIYTRSGGLWTQQGSKLVGTGYSGSSYQGISVSISADGNTAIVGGTGDNSTIGAAWIYTRSGGIWTQQGGKLVGSGASGASRQGQSVSISADGNTAIVGGFYDNSTIGAAWIYTRSGGIWTQEGGKLVGTGAVGISGQGIAVSLSADGNTAIVGGYRDNTDIGAAWIYTRSGSIWTQQGSKLVGSGYVGNPVYQGNSVSLSADGNTAMVGGQYDNSGIGASWIFTRSGSTWTQQGGKLVGSGATGASRQGQTVSLSADGNTAILGGWGDNNNIGAVWIYSRSGNIWTQQGNKLVGSAYAGTPYQGYSVAISADGSTALFGGHWDNSGIGAAWAYITLPEPPSALAGSNIFTTSFTANWNVSTGATGYKLDVDDNNDFSSPVVNDLDVESITTKTITGLTPSTAYYYRVRAYNTNGPSGSSNIITVTTLHTQTITFSALSDKTYGDIPFDLSATGGGSGNPVTFTSSDVTVVSCTGLNGVTVTILKAGSCNIYANQAGNESYAAAEQVGQILLIDPKNLTISGISISNKIYDGNTTATITGIPALDGVVGTDDADLVSTSASALFDTKDTGTGKVVTITGYSLSGTDIGNYTLTQPIGLTADITKATPVITWSDPADIIENSALSATQLNATANVTGTFVYTPPAGTVLDIGNNHPLQADFTPDDGTNYNSTSETVFINVLVMTGIGDNNITGTVIYPNPVTNEIFVDIGMPTSLINIIISDLTGKVIMVKTKISSSSPIDLSALAPGIYIIHIETDNGLYRAKILKQ